MSAVKLALKVDSSNPVIGDLFLGNNSGFKLTQSLSEEVSQLLYTRFRSFKGEWFLDPTIGIPYYQTILGQKTSLPIVARVLRQVVLTCPGVSSVRDFKVNPQPNRGLVVEFSCLLTDGVVLRSSDFAPFVIGG